MCTIHDYSLDSESYNISPSDLKHVVELEKFPKLTPKFNVVLLDDNDHTYDYVIEMLMKIFNRSRYKAFEMACEVDFTDRVIVFTGSKKISERKRNQILSYGPDLRLERSKGSMLAILESVE